MKKMSLKDFSDYVLDGLEHEYTYSTDNQQKCNTPISMMFSLSFNQILITYLPNVICLKNTTGCLLLKKVKYIIQNNKKLDSCKIFNIVCGDRNNDENDVVHTLLVR